MCKKKSFWLILVLVLIFGFIYLNKNKTQNTVHEDQNKQNFSIEVFWVDTLGWGYKIFDNDKPFIVQERIPATAGTKRFKTKDDAQKCAELVVTKINNFDFPSISKNELDSLGVVYE